MRKTTTKTKDLEVEISFLQGLRRRMPKDVDVLKILGDDLTKVGRYEEGLEVDLKLVAINPDDPMVHYNLACSYSILEQVDKAGKSLKRAIALGYSDWRWMESDSDLKNLRASPHYEGIRRLAEKQSGKVS